MRPAVQRRFTGYVVLAIVIAVRSSDAAAQSIVCYTFQPGDTASTVAWRLTGRADAHRRPWFQIVNSAASRPISKAQYGHVLPGWQACIPASAALSRAAGTGLQPIIDRVARTGGSAAPQPNRAMGLAYLFWAAAAVGIAIGFGWQAVEQFVAKRRALIGLMQRFGDVFVKDFEGPLIIEGVVTRPILARLRCVPSDQRLDILLALAAGRRYPNLEDHKQNLEYDVDRIAQRLRHHPFVRQPLRAEGRWVVVPFQLKSGPKTGAAA